MSLVHISLLGMRQLAVYAGPGWPGPAALQALQVHCEVSLQCKRPRGNLCGSGTVTWSLHPADGKQMLNGPALDRVVPL